MTIKMRTDTSSTASTENLTETAQAIDAATRLLGQMTWLLSQSPPHKHLFITDIDWYLLPAIRSGQFRVWIQGGQPVGFALWANVDDEIHASMEGGLTKVPPGKWQSGGHLWLIDLVAPFGGGQNLFTDLVNTVFAGKAFHYLEYDSNIGKMNVKRCVGRGDEAAIPDD